MASLGIEFVVRDAESRGPHLVLLHCLGVDHRFWDPLLPALGQRFTVWRTDLPGHGTARPAPGPYGIADLSQQLAGVFKTFDIGRAHVAGISLGGLIAQQFAADHPALVDRLVLIDTTPRYTDEMRAMWVKRAAAARTAGVPAQVDDLLAIWFSPAAVSANAPGVAYVRRTLNACSGEGYALACEALGAADLRALAGRITAPTLVVCGDDDIPSFLDAARWLEASIKGARLAWIPGTRHASVLEQPDVAGQLIGDFLVA